MIRAANIPESWTLQQRNPWMCNETLPVTTCCCFQMGENLYFSHMRQRTSVDIPGWSSDTLLNHPKDFQSLGVNLIEQTAIICSIPPLLTQIVPSSKILLDGKTICTQEHMHTRTRFLTWLTVFNSPKCCVFSPYPGTRGNPSSRKMSVKTIIIDEKTGKQGNHRISMNKVGVVMQMHERWPKSSIFNTVQHLSLGTG